jgi:hypothetical protein
LIMKNLLCILALAASAGLLLANDAAARGFGGGGFHGGGGGFHGGGSFHAGGFSGGGLHAGGINAAGLHDSSFHAGGFNTQTFRAGGLSAGGFHADGVSAGGFHAGGINAQSLRGGRASVGGFDRSGYQNFANRAAPNRTQLNGFLGLPSDAGMHALGSTHSIDGYNIHHGSIYGPAGGRAHGTVVTGPQGGQVAHGGVRGPGGNVAHGSAWHGAYNDGYVGFHSGFRRVTPSYRYNQAVVVRRGFHSWSAYTPGWYRRYPGAWFAAGWAAGYAWRAATWPSVYGWFDYPYLAPVYYDYGNNVVYNNNNVYVNGQDVGSSSEYYDQANQLAATGTAAKAPQDTKWLPLGVFAVSREDNTKTNMVMQLAVNKAGIIRGNYTDSLTGSTQKIHGSVDKKTQRAAWTIGDNTSTVIETGIYNLTKDEAPALVHLGKDRTQQWLLVRVTQNDKPAPSE